MVKEDHRAFASTPTLRASSKGSQIMGAVSPVPSFTLCGLFRSGQKGRGRHEPRSLLTSVESFWFINVPSQTHRLIGLCQESSGGLFRGLLVPGLCSSHHATIINTNPDEPRKCGNVLPDQCGRSQGKAEPLT